MVGEGRCSDAYEVVSALGLHLRTNDSYGCNEKPGQATHSWSCPLCAWGWCVGRDCDSGCYSAPLRL